MIMEDDQATLAGMPQAYNRDNLEYELIVRQEPKQARMCGVGTKADRRPIDPPPVVQLRVIDKSVSRSSSPDEHQYSHSFLQNPYYFMYASLASPDRDEELHLLKDGKTRCTTGSVVSSLYHLKDPEAVTERGQARDAGFFVFPDLSVRTEGTYRLKLTLFEVVGANVHHCKSIFSAPFYVYTAKKFPGMEESTNLSCALADQGIKIRIRKDVRIRKRTIDPAWFQPLPPDQQPYAQEEDEAAARSDQEDDNEDEVGPSSAGPSSRNGRDAKRQKTGDGTTLGQGLPPPPSSASSLPPVQNSMSAPPPPSSSAGWGMDPSLGPSQQPQPQQQPPSQHPQQQQIPPPPMPHTASSSSVIASPEHAAAPYDTRASYGSAAPLPPPVSHQHQQQHQPQHPPPEYHHAPPPPQQHPGHPPPHHMQHAPSHPPPPNGMYAPAPYGQPAAWGAPPPPPMQGYGYPPPHQQAYHHDARGPPPPPHPSQQMHPPPHYGAPMHYAAPPPPPYGYYDQHGQYIPPAHPAAVPPASVTPTQAGQAQAPPSPRSSAQTTNGRSKDSVGYSSQGQVPSAPASSNTMNASPASGYPPQDYAYGRPPPPPQHQQQPPPQQQTQPQQPQLNRAYSQPQPPTPYAAHPGGYSPYGYPQDPGYQWGQYGGTYAPPGPYARPPPHAPQWGSPAPQQQQQMQGSPPPPPPPSSSSAAGDPYAGYGGARGGGVEDGRRTPTGRDRIQLAPLRASAGTPPQSSSNGGGAYGTYSTLGRGPQYGAGGVGMERSGSGGSSGPGSGKKNPLSIGSIISDETN